MNFAMKALLSGSSSGHHGVTYIMPCASLEAGALDRRQQIEPERHDLLLWRSRIRAAALIGVDGVVAAIGEGHDIGLGILRLQDEGGEIDW